MGELHGGKPEFPGYFGAEKPRSRPSALTDYRGALNGEKLRRLREALRVALAIE